MEALTIDLGPAAANIRARVLVIDDDESVRELLRLHLSNAGYDVVLAEDAVVAGYLILQHAPELIILDVNMPYMDGYQFAAALKADPEIRKIPVIFLSSREDVGEHARRLGAVAHLSKPLLAARLLEVVALYV
jgi:CheY-like chemotaxis protein